jgi:hypothetical protein
MDEEKWKEGAIRGREEKNNKNQKHQNPKNMHKTSAKIPRQMTRNPKTQKKSTKIEIEKKNQKAMM